MKTALTKLNRIAGMLALVGFLTALFMLSASREGISYPGYGGGGSGGFSGGTVPSPTTFSDDVTLNGGTGALGFASGETLVPADSLLNVTGALTATGNVYSGGQIQANGLYLTGGANWSINDGTNYLVRLYDDGTTGYLQSTSTKQTGTITLAAGTGTATVRSGAVCVCTDTTANASVQCAVATTTLTATGTASDVIAYWCN